MLHEFDGLGREQGGIVGLVGILDGSTIDRLVPGTRGVLGSRGRWVMKLVEGFLDVCGHGDVTNALVVVPVNGDTAIEGYSPVYGDGIELLERLYEIVRCVFANLLETEIVDHKGEADVFGGNLPKGRGPSDRGVSKLGKVDLEPIVCNAAGLFQAWHVFADLQVYPSVGCELEEVVLGNDLFWEYRQSDFHILVTPHGGIVIKILNVQSDEVGTGGGDGDVQKEFSCS